MQPAIAHPNIELADIELASIGPGPHAEGSGAAGAGAPVMVGARSIGTLSAGFARLPPTALLLLAIVAVQLGGALASFVFSTLGPIGVTFASSFFAALLLTLFGRPQPFLRGSRALALRHWRLVLAYGAVNVALSLFYYLALERIPLGILATITFLGPLGLAVVTSRRLVHFMWIGIAAVGVALLAPDIGATLDQGLDPIGLGYAAISGAAWAGFVIFSKRTGVIFPGSDGLTLALWVCALALLPAALLEGSIQQTGVAGIAGALGVALLGVILPLLLEFQALRKMSARTYGILVTLEPAIGALVGMILLGQPAGPRMIVAVACVTLAALGVTLSDRRDSE